MGKRSYKGDKRRREVQKQRKQAEKRRRKETGETKSEVDDDKAYLEYLYPGGVPEELKSDGEEDEDGDTTDEESADEDRD
jgi:hypothetical protein